jgi:hypothetical protein
MLRSNGNIGGPVAEPKREGKVGTPGGSFKPARLEDFREERLEEAVRYSLPLSDETGERTHELLILGAEDQIRESLGESEFEVTIRPDVSEEDWASEASRQFASADQVVPREAFDHPKSWLKDPPPRPTADNCVVIAVRQERPGGTGLSLAVRNLSLSPPRFSLFVPAVGPNGAAWFDAQVQPISGDPDIFLFGGVGVGRFSSTAPDGIWDRVWCYNYPRPPTWFSFFGFFPAVEIRPFTACATLFTASWWCLPF